MVFKGADKFSCFRAAKAFYRVDAAEYRKTLEEATAILKELAGAISAEMAMVVLLSGAGYGLARCTRLGFGKSEESLTVLSAENCQAIAKTLEGCNNSEVDVREANALLGIIGEEPVADGFGWRFVFCAGLTVILVLGFRKNLREFPWERDLSSLKELTGKLLRSSFHFLVGSSAENSFLSYTLNRLLEINRIIIEGGEFEAVLNHVTDAAKEIVGAQEAGLLLWDENSQCLRLQKPAFGTFDDRIINLYRVTMQDGGNAIQVFRSMEPYFSNNPQEDPRFIPNLLQLFPPKNVLSVPVVVSGKPIGVLHAINKKEGFSEDDVTVLSLLVSQLAVAIENAQLVWRIKKEEAQSKALYELSRGFRLKNVQELFQAAVDIVSRVLGVPMVALAIGEKGNLGRVVAVAGAPRAWIGEAVELSTKELEAGEPGTSFGACGKIEEEARGLGMTAQLIVAVKSSADLFGQFWIWNNKHWTVSASEKNFLLLVANQLGILLENADLYRREKRTAERLERFLEVNEQLVWLILHGAGVQAITECLGRYLRAGVAFYDHRFIRQASTRLPEEKLFLLDAVLARVTANDFGRRPRPDSFCILNENVPGQKVFILPIQIENNTLGYLCVLPEQVKDTEEDEDFQSVIQRTLPVYALELVKQRIIHGVLQDAEREFISALLEGKYPEEEIQARAVALGHDLRRPNVIALMEGGADSSYYETIAFPFRQTLLGEVRVYLKQYLPRSLAAALNQGQLAILVPCEADSEMEILGHLKAMVEDLKKQLASVFAQDVYIGVGCPARSLPELNRSYREACFTVKYMRQTRSRECVMAFRDLGLYQALADESAAGSLADFSRNLINPLMEEDLKKGTAYLKTLDLYFENGCSIKAAAESLFCHANTVYYRIKRVENLLKIDLGNIEDKCRLLLALKVAKFMHPGFFI